MQARNWVLSADSTQIAAPLPRAWLLTECPAEASTFTCFPPENGLVNVIFSQAKSPGFLVVALIFPALKMISVKKNKEFLAFCYLWVIKFCWFMKSYTRIACEGLKFYEEVCIRKFFFPCVPHLYPHLHRNETSALLYRWKLPTTTTNLKTWH